MRAEEATFYDGVELSSMIYQSGGFDCSSRLWRLLDSKRRHVEKAFRKPVSGGVPFD